MTMISKMNRPNTPLQSIVVTVMIIFVIFVLFNSCESKEANEKERHVRNLVEYLNHHSIDSAILTQPFFNDTFKAKHKSYDLYLASLKELQTRLRANDAMDITVDSSNKDVYIVNAPNSTPIFILVKTDGVESFIPFFKSGEIVSWL